MKGLRTLTALACAGSCLLNAPALAQESACHAQASVRVCCAEADAPRCGALIERLLEMGVTSRLQLDVDEWTETQVSLRIAGSSEVLHVPLGDLPHEPEGLDVRARTVAMVVRDHGAELDAEPPLWTDERPLATDEERAAYGFVPSPVLTPRPGLWSLTLRGRGLAMLDRAGAALDGELSVEHILTDAVSFGVEVAPAWFAVGERIAGGLAGGMALAHVLFHGDFIAGGVYGGIAAIPRPGTPLAAIVGLRLRLGLYDHAHVELRGSVAYNDALGALFGEARLQVLVPASRAVEIVVARGDLAFELGWMGIEAGVRYWPSEGREAGDSGLEITVGARTHVFVQRCELGGCTPEWGAGGPTVSAAWITRLR